MKHFFLTIAIALFSTINLMGGIAPVSTSLEVVADEIAIVLNLDNLAAETQKFTITDSNGEIAFTDSVEKYEHNVKYILNDLPIGNYTFQIDGKNYIEYIEANITDDVIDIISTQSYFMPVVLQKEEKVMVNARFTRSEEIKVDIYTLKGDLVYSWEESRIGEFEKVFNLSLLEKGNYDILVSTDHFSKFSRVEL